MCAVVAPENVDAFLAVCRKWEVLATVIGEVTDGDRLRITWHGETVVDVPPRTVAHEAGAAASPEQHIRDKRIRRRPHRKPSLVIGSPDEIKTPPSDDYSPPNNLIEHLCGAKRRRDGNGDGQSRYFGPTSSLHFTETPATLTINGNSSRLEAYAYENLTPETQELCLNLYWMYQHPVLCCIHKEAFLAGMKAGCGPYYSRCLLYCVLASGARISERREIRALTIPTTEEEKLEKRSVIPNLTFLAKEALITNALLTRS